MGVSRALLPGAAHGAALVLDEPLSMWGGLDAESGRIIDRRHPQVGERVTGTVLVLPWGRGSSSAASVLAEAIRVGTAPTAIILSAPDDIILLGALVAEELYERTCPIVVADPEIYATLRNGERVEIQVDGTITASDPGPV